MRVEQDVPPLSPRENLYGVVPSDVKKRAHPSLRSSMVEFDERISAALEYNSYAEFHPLSIDSRLRWFLDRTIEHWGMEHGRKMDKKREVKDINGSFIDGISLVHTLKIKSDETKEKELPITLGFVPVDSKNETIDILIPRNFPPISRLTPEMAVATIIKAINLEILKAKNPPKEAVEFTRSPTPQAPQPALA